MCFRVRNCCCGCTSLENGARILGVLGVVFTGLATLWAAWETANARSLSEYLEFMRNSTEEGSEQEYNYRLMYLMPHPSFMLMVYAPILFFDILLLLGAYKRSPCLLIPWLVFRMIGIVLMCILVVLAVVGGIVISAIYGPYRNALPFVIVFVLTAPCLALSLYFFHVVYSYMKELQEEQRQGQFQTVPMGEVGAKA